MGMEIVKIISQIQPILRIILLLTLILSEVNCQAEQREPESPSEVTTETNGSGSVSPTGALLLLQGITNEPTAILTVLDDGSNENGGSKTDIPITTDGENPNHLYYETPDDNDIRQEYEEDSSSNNTISTDENVNSPYTEDTGEMTNSTDIDSTTTNTEGDSNSYNDDQKKTNVPTETSSFDLAHFNNTNYVSIIITTEPTENNGPELNTTSDSGDSVDSEGSKEPTSAPAGDIESSDAPTYSPTTAPTIINENTTALTAYPTSSDINVDEPIAVTDDPNSSSYHLPCSLTSTIMSLSIIMLLSLL